MQPGPDANDGGGKSLAGMRLLVDRFSRVGLDF